MKQLIVTVALILLGVFIANTLVLGADSNSLRSGANTIADKMIEEIEVITVP